MLIEREGEIANRDEIKKRLWPNDTVVEFDFGINNTIKNLRRVLGDSADDPKYIDTIKGRGYRLLVPVEWVGVADSGADSDFQALQAAQKTGSLTGKVVSHYRVLEVIGGGGMGLVYRAENLKLGRAVALKFLPEEVGDDPKARERFEREAHAVSALNHTNICTVYDFDEHEGRPFIAMELLQGKTLREHLADGRFRLTEPAGLEIAIQIASGLEAAHEKGIIHRDIKPANIFITDKNVAKILDFGVAKVMQLAEPEPTLIAAAASETDSAQCEATHLTRTGTKLGTAGYMSPEQIRGEPLDARTDIFSFGLVLYEMATGERAFGGETEAALHDAIEYRDPKPVRELAPEISLSLAETIEKCLEKEPEQRLQTGIELRSALLEAQHASSPVVPPPLAEDKPRARHRKLWVAVALSAALLIAVIATVIYRRAHASPKFTDKDTIVLADFENKTGDEVFDGSLTEALRVGLEQTPFLNLLATDKVNRVAKEIGLSNEQALTSDKARQVCLKTNSAVVVAGSISDAGNGYQIALRALRCDTGRVIAGDDRVAEQRSTIIRELGLAAVKLRKELGEPSKTIQEFSRPLEIATTSSAEALRSLVLGKRERIRKGDEEAMPFFSRAVEIDPNFAMAYLRLGSALWNLNRRDPARESLQKAYELRDRMTKRQHFEVTGNYFGQARGDLEKAAKEWAEMARLYPNSSLAHGYLAWTLRVLGKYADSASEAREAIRLEPSNYAPYANLMRSETAMGRYSEAKAAFDEERSHGLDNELLRPDRYFVAFLEDDKGGMQEQLDQLRRMGHLDSVLNMEALTELYFGHWRSFRRSADEWVSNSARRKNQESVADGLAALATAEQEIGETSRAREHAAAAAGLSSERMAVLDVAYALARSGNPHQAEQLTAQLKAEAPDDTRVKSYEPCVEVAIAMNRNAMVDAIDTLETSCPNNLAQPVLSTYEINWRYIRGLVYLKGHEAEKAASAFQSVLDHPGEWVIEGSFYGALARLQLARAYAMIGNKDAARKSYHDFLTLWKDADPDIPIYRQAKAEYAKLR